MREFLSLLESLVNLNVQLENAEIEKLRICSATALGQLNIWAQFQNQQTALANEAMFRWGIINILAQENAGLMTMLGRLYDSRSPNPSAARQERFAKDANQLLTQINNNTQAMVQISGQPSWTASWGPSLWGAYGHSYCTPAPMMQPSAAYAMPATMGLRRYDYPYLQQPQNSPTVHF